VHRNRHLCSRGIFVYIFPRKRTELHVIFLILFFHILLHVCGKLGIFLFSIVYFLSLSVEWIVKSQCNFRSPLYIESPRVNRITMILYGFSHKNIMAFLKNACVTHTHPFNVPFSGTTQVSRYQKGKTNLDFTEARDSEWQWHQLGHMHR